MIARVLEPEVMDTPGEAAEYDAMDHSDVNQVFVDDLLAAFAKRRTTPSAWDQSGCRPTVLDIGTGTALIPVGLCRRDEFVGQVIAIDLADEMLTLARRNIDRAGLSRRVRVERIDAKSMPYADASFDVVTSNSIVHHIPDPLVVLREMVRVLSSGGLLFVRDLLRPESEADVERIVQAQAADETPRSRQLFRQSLWAALTVAELQELAETLSLPRECVRQTSDRHWTLSWRRPA
ncbi:MAG: class I SAM-dependent methyltransferase [Planctomycetaceae bacterium]